MRTVRRISFFTKDLYPVDMAPFYEELCTELKWTVDKALLAKMQANNEEKFKQLDETLKDAEENLGETEIRDALYAKAEYLCKIGEKVQTETLFSLEFLNDKVLLFSSFVTLFYILIYLVGKSHQRHHTNYILKLK